MMGHSDWDKFKRIPQMSFNTPSTEEWPGSCGIVSPAAHAVRLIRVNQVVRRIHGVRTCSKWTQ